MLVEVVEPLTVFFSLMVFAERLLSCSKTFDGIQGVQGHFRSNPLPTFTFLFSSAALTCPLLLFISPFCHFCPFPFHCQFFRSCVKGKAMLQYKETDRPSMMEVLDFEYFKTAAHEPPGKHG